MAGLFEEAGINPDQQKKMQEVLDLAIRLHGTSGDHQAFTFQSMAEHVEEIRELAGESDPHWKAETVDLIIHGLLLLKDADVGPAELDQLIDRRLGRFREKITAALQAEQQKK